MKKIYLNAPVDYVSGYLRYGHYEGELNLTDEEYEKFKTDPQKFLIDDDGLADLALVVDDWRIEDVGDLIGVNWKEI